MSARAMFASIYARDLDWSNRCLEKDDRNKYTDINDNTAETHVQHINAPNRLTPRTSK